MDEVQKKLKDIQKTVLGCVDSRQKLRSALLDFLPAEKLRCNLLLNAYDEEVVSKLTGGRDTTLAALNMIKALKDSYGVMDDLAFWSVETWCYILGFDEVAEAMSAVRPSEVASQTAQPALAAPKSQTYEFENGMYRVGVDIPAGEYLVKPNRKSKGSSLCSVYKNPKKIEDSWLFCTQGYIVIKQGEYLKVSPDENGMKLIFTPVG